MARGGLNRMILCFVNQMKAKLSASKPVCCDARHVKYFCSVYKWNSMGIGHDIIKRLDGEIALASDENIIKIICDLK